MQKNSSTIICNNCHKENIKTNKFCQYCGEKLLIDNKKSVIKDDDTIQKSSKISDNKLKKNNYLVLILIIIFIIIAFVFCLLFNFYSNNKTQTTIKKDVTVTDTGIADSVEKVMNSVVVVESYQNGKLYATGTGFVFKTDDNNGYILTNNHVISSATDVYIIFTNNTKEKVNIVGKDTYSDIAVLSINKNKVLSIASIGSSDKLRVGDTTFAVGAPINAEAYSWTVTRGILSGKNRKVEVTFSNNNSSSLVMEVLQTDAAINAGNSGGPLCNANGEVIGITNMKISSSNNSIEGMGFAIPIETAVNYANKFLNKEVIVRPYLGISMYDMSNGVLTSATGVYVAAVEDNSPASKAGIKVGDTIIALDDKTVQNSSYLKYELYKHNVGDTINITLVRNNKEIKVKVVLSSINKTT